MSSGPNHYDVIIVGAGVAGCALAHALSTIPCPSQLRIALLERSLAEPDRIVGELLQPGGVIALRNLGLESCLEGIDAISVKGYCVLEGGKPVHIPYPGNHEGRSFHHGKFIMNLRQAALRAKGVDVIEATVTELLEVESGKFSGVRATRNGSSQDFYADLTIIADGCSSNFRSSVMGQRGCKPVTKSYFVGAILEDAVLPIPKHGTVALIKNSGPVLLYQIGEHDTRILVDVKHPLPSNLKNHLLENIFPQLPQSLHPHLRKAVESDRLRRMPNSFLPPVLQGQSSHNIPMKENVFLVGDAWNMRHPLTGGGMTVALHDIVLLRDLLAPLAIASSQAKSRVLNGSTTANGSAKRSVPQKGTLGDWYLVRKALRTWFWQRKPLASTVNILSVALYDLFGADDENLAILRLGCFKYFECGGECVKGPVSLLSAIARSPALLFYHFFSVALYSIWVMFTHPRPISGTSSKDNGEIKQRMAAPRLDQYPFLFFKAISVFWTACVVFGPLLWSEIRWWSPDDKKASRKVATVGLLGLAASALASAMIVNWFGIPNLFGLSFAYRLQA